MRTEDQDTFQDVEIQVVTYRVGDGENLDDVLDEYISQTMQIQRMMGMMDGGSQPSFTRQQGRAEIRLASYGESELTLMYAGKIPHKWKVGKIIKATVSDGQFAQNLIEYCMNNHGELSRTSAQPPKSLADTLLGWAENTGRRILNLRTGANYSDWAERYDIFVAEV